MMRRRISWILIALGFALCAIWVGRVGLIAQSLRARLAQIENPGAINLATGCELIWNTQSDLAVLRGQVGGLIAITPILGWLPGVGTDLRAAPELLFAASDVSDGGALLCDALARGGANDQDLASIARALGSDSPDVQTAIAYFARADQTIARVDAAALSPTWSRRVDALQHSLPLARALPLVSTLAGIDQPRTYLVLALNEDELRPGGGFITGVGEIKIENARITAISFRDSYAVDDFTKPYPDPPEPLRRYMEIDQWVLRDSNWSADFPISARQAVALYRPSSSFDGVIAIDQRAVQDLVSVIGPLKVAESADPITGKNIIAYIQRAWAPSDGTFSGAWWLRRKSFMGPLADAARARLEAGQFDKIALAKTTLNLIESKHLQMYFDHPVAQKILRDQNWDGALRKSSSDYLMIVDANLGYNKVNARVQQSLAYQVDLRVPRPAVELTLVYTHTGATANPCRPEIRYDLVYEQMMNRCYWDYARVLVLPTTRIDNATRVEIPATALFTRQIDPGAVIARASDDGAYQSLEAMTLIAPGKNLTRRFALTLAEDVVQWRGAQGQYTLLIQKQAGTINYPVAIQVRLPDQTVLIDARPKPFTTESDVIAFQFALERDIELHIQFKRR